MSGSHIEKGAKDGEMGDALATLDFGSLDLRKPWGRQGFRHWVNGRVRKRGLLERGSFQKSSFSRDSREFRECRDF